ncbi:MAG: dephospho-CoA kinase [Nitrospirota bacterium]
MVWVGLTGGIASGKSTVSQMFKEAGAFIVDADKIVHDLLSQRGAVFHQVLNFFGTGILDGTGQIDRKKLGAIVFNDPKKLSALNKMVHPHVFLEAEREGNIVGLEDPRRVIVFDAPLLIETRAHKKVDLVVLVYVDQATQIKRLSERDGLTEEAANARIALQMSLEAKRAYANEIIDNRKSIPEVQEAVNRISQMLWAAG